MKKYFSGLAVVCLIFVSSVYAADAVTSKQVAFSNATKPIMVSKLKPEFTLRLKDNPTTGFSWYIESYDPHVLEVVKQKYIPPSKKLIGAPGMSVWTFKLNPDAFKAPHMTRIKMVYTRPWETKEQTEKVFTVVTYGCNAGPSVHNKNGDNVDQWVC